MAIKFSRLLQIIKEEVENWFNDEPSIADTYYDKQLGISTPKPQEDQNINGELLGYVTERWNTPLEKAIPIYKNPKALNEFDNSVSGVLLNNGDLYVGLKKDAMHKNILELLAEKGIIPYNKIFYYDHDLPEEFITVYRTFNQNIFTQSYGYDEFPSYYQETFDIANNKHSYKFRVLPRHNNLKEMESPLDNNYQFSYLPQDYQHNIMDEKK